MKRAAELRAYLFPAVVFNTAVALLIMQSLGAPASRAERITWLAVAAVLAAVLAYQINAARAYRRLFRSACESFDSLKDSYGKLSASRDYWKERVMAGETPDGLTCARCRRATAPATGGCQHEICGWCAWCPACAGTPRSGMIP